MSKYHGIFLLETKSHRGQMQVSSNNLLVNGKLPEKDFVGQI